MHSSNNDENIKTGFFRRTPVQLIASVILFVIFVGIITHFVCDPFKKIYSNENQFQAVFLGASETEWGINPEVVEAETGMKSCLLATSGCNYDGRYEMLKAAIEQESLEYVVMDTSIDSLNQFTKAVFPIDIRVLYFSRINGLFNKLDTAVRTFSFWEDEYDQLYAEMLYEGLNSWQDKADGSYDEIFLRHGYDPQERSFSSLTEEEALDTHNSVALDTEWLQIRIDGLKKIAQLCKEHDVKLILMTFPISEANIWQHTGWDEFHELMAGLSEELEVPYYDFNLLKDRQDYFSDDITYRDEEHLCSEGADIFSAMVSQVLRSTHAGEESGYEFYDSYEEAEEHSSYMKYLE